MDVEATMTLEREVELRDADDITLVSSACRTAALRLGATAANAGRLDLVVRELGWNLLRHAGGGGLRLLSLRQQHRCGIVVESHDHGPGISGMPAGRSRGPCPGKGLGIGLAAVQRNSSEFSMCSASRGGTLIRAVIWWPSRSS